MPSLSQLIAGAAGTPTGFDRAAAGQAALRGGWTPSRLPGQPVGVRDFEQAAINSGRIDPVLAASIGLGRHVGPLGGIAREHRVNSIASEAQRRVSNVRQGFRDRAARDFENFFPISGPDAPDIQFPVSDMGRSNFQPGAGGQFSPYSQIGTNTIKQTASPSVTQNLQSKTQIGQVNPLISQAFGKPNQASSLFGGVAGALFQRGR